MKKIITVLSIIFTSLALVGCKFEEEKDYDLLNPTRVAVMSLDILDMLNEVGIENTGIKELGVLFKGNVDYLDAFNTKDVVDLGTHNAFNLDALEKLQPEVIILGSRVSDKYTEFSLNYPRAIIYNATNSIQTGGLLSTMELNVEFLSGIFPSIADSLAEKFLDVETNVLDVKKSNTNELRALMVMLSGNEIKYYGTKSRFGMIYTEFGYKPVEDNDSIFTNHGEPTNMERIAEFNPDLIFVLDRSATIGQSGVSVDFDAFVKNGKNNNINAFLNEKIYQLNGDAWYMTSGGFTSANRMVQDMLKGLSK